MDSETEEPVRRKVKADWRSLIWLALVCLFAYGNSLSNGFVWLDESEILEAEYRVETPDDLWQVFVEPLDQYSFRAEGQARSRGGYWRPIYALTISIDWWLWGENAFVYHLVNLCLHMLVVGLLYYVASQLCSSEQELTKVFWATLLFAALPSGVQSVGWISGRKDLVCALFSLLSLGCLLQGVTASKTRYVVLGGLGALAGLILALGCKELAVVLPAVCACLLLSANREWASIRRTWALWLTMASAIPVYLLLRQQVLGQIGFAAGAGEGTWMAFAGNLCRLLASYFFTVLLPFPSTLSDRWVSSTGIYGAEIVSMLLVLSLLVWALESWRRGNWLSALGVLWFFIWLAPVLGAIPLRHAWAERYLYPASWGLLLATVDTVFRWSQWVVGERIGIPWLGSRVRNVGMVVWLSVLVFLTASENRHWRSTESLFRAALRVDPFYLEGHVALGHVMWEQQRYDEALEMLDAAVDLSKRDLGKSYWSPYVAYLNRGATHRALEEHYEALKDFTIAHRLQPKLLAPLEGLALTHIALGQWEDAEKQLKRALESAPGTPSVLGNLALVYLNQNLPDQSVQILAKLVQDRRGTLGDRQNLGTSYLLLEDYQNASELFGAIVKEVPDSIVDRAKLAWALHGIGQSKRAAEIVEQLQREAPLHPTVRYVANLLD